MNELSNGVLWLSTEHLKLLLEFAVENMKWQLIVLTNSTTAKTVLVMNKTMPLRFQFRANFCLPQFQATLTNVDFKAHFKKVDDAPLTLIRTKCKTNSVFCFSAGVHRNWVGVPRQYFKPGTREPACVCVRTSGPAEDTGKGDIGDLDNPHLREYEGCGKFDVSCKLRS